MDAEILEGFSQLWRDEPGPAGAPGPARPEPGPRFDPCDAAALARAARIARERYPGAAGELLSSEIAAFLQVGRRFAAPQTIVRLVTELLDDE